MWVLLSISASFFSAISLLLTKYFTKKLSPFALFFVINSIGLPGIFLLFLSHPIPKLSPLLFVYLVISTVFDIVAFYCSFTAIAEASLSLIAPLLAFVPVGATLFAIIFLHEVPTPIKFFGIFLTGIGAYLLHISELQFGLTAPFKKLISDQNVRLVGISVFLWSITPTLQKKAIYATFPPTPLIAPIVEGPMVSLVVLLLVWKQIPAIKQFIFQNKKILVLYAVASSYIAWATYTAFATQYVGYVLAILRSSGFFTVILAGVFFKEKNVREKLLGTGIIFLGVLLLSI